MIYGDNNSSVPDINAIRQSTNKYVYAMNNPIRYTDPTGHVSKDTADQRIKDNAYFIKSAANEFGVQAGDLLYWCGKYGDDPHHAAIVTKVENGEIYYNAHNKPRDVATLSDKLGDEIVKIIRIRDEAVLGYKL